MSLRVIEGGVDREAPPPIVWNRLPIEDQRRALVIRDANLDGSRDRCELAWDDGRPFLIGIRTVRTVQNPAALEAWRSLAALIGAEVRDERQIPDPFAEADANNARAALAARIEAKRREREATRDMQPMAAGGLFDEVHRNTRDLFNPET